MADYLVRNVDGSLLYDKIRLLKPGSLKAIDNPIRIKILEFLIKKPMYPAEIAHKLEIHEQKVYYHIGKLMHAGVLQITEKKEIRGTIAKKFKPKNTCFGISIDFNGKSINELSKQEEPELDNFLEPFIKDGKLDAKIVVGSPDPHGKFKARARDGHYAIELALMLGNHCRLGDSFATRLDVDIKLNEEHNLIIVGGPITNLTMAKVNKHLPARFSEKKGWGIDAKETYSDDNIGLIGRIKNPHNPEYSILAVAGIRYGGTKSAVIALTKFSKLVLNRFSGQKEFYCIVQGYDLNGDGKVDSVEVLE